jgi:tRNA pseudouridine55 synthase
MHVEIITPEQLLEGTVLFFNKPINWTSFDVVNKVRYQIKLQKNISKIKVGHAGTLDPLATGLLIVCTGKKTKEIDTFSGLDKEYIVTFKFGETTPSFDKETEVDFTFPIDHLNEELIRKVLNSFIGLQEQMPPDFSAKKIMGKRAYKSARLGKKPDLKPAMIEIKEIEIIKINLPFITLRIVSGKGTYIRAIARDLGLVLNTGAYLTELKRTKIGKFTLDDAITVEQFQKML